MSGITLSAGVRANLLQLQNTAALTQMTQERLSTGRDVNSALDNPSNFFTSQSLSSRAGDLSGLLDSMSGAINTVNAADKALTAITKLVEAASATAQQALAEGSSYEAAFTGTAITASLAEQAETDKTTREQVRDSLLVDIGGTNGAGIAANDTVTITNTDGASEQTYTFTSTATSTMGDLVDAINDSGIAEASITSDGKLQVTTDDSSGTTSITVNTATAANAAKIGGFTDEAAANLVAVADPDATIDADRAKALETQFNELRSQIDKLVKDAGYNGTNLLQGDDLKVVFNEKVGDKQSSLKIDGVSFDAETLGVPTKSDVTFTNGSSVEKAVEKLNDVVDTLRNQQQNFGSSLSIVQIRKDFTQDMVNTLQKGADELVLADPNEEGANLLALQTRQQLSSTALGLANRADQAVLRLF